MKTTNLKVTHPGIKLYFLTEILPDTNTAKKSTHIHYKSMGGQLSTKTLS